MTAEEPLRCTGKQQHESKSAAMAQLVSLKAGARRRNSKHDKRKLNAYKCKCGYWHIGHQPT